jgi:CheY-like chemotaxis protein
LPVHVMGDPARLQQILNNLLSNAFKFTEKGEVALTVKLIDRISEDRVLLRIEVKDSGIGISEEAMSRLFNPFQQADSTTSRRYGGTGLGLAICKKIVELMGGHIHAASSANEGSRFWADIPFNIAQREEARYLTKAQSIKDKRIAMVLRFPEFNKIYISALDYWQANTQIINPDTEPESLDWPHIDVMYISDMLPMPLLLSWIETAKHNNCPIILANGYGENYRPSDIAETATLRRLQQPMSKARLADLLHQIIHNISPSTNDSSNGISGHNVSALHLLVAEDNEVNTKVLQALFAKHAINADFVVNGEQAVKAYSAEPNRFDAILMDCEMPILNGFEATTQIRQFELDNRHTPITIIALTAHALLETRDACMACGMNDILTKPVNFSALLSRLEQVAVANYA